MLRSIWRIANSLTRDSIIALDTDTKPPEIDTRRSDCYLLIEELARSIVQRRADNARGSEKSPFGEPGGNRPDMQNAIRRLMRPDDMLEVFNELAVREPDLMRLVLQASVAALVNAQTVEVVSAELKQRAVAGN